MVYIMLLVAHSYHEHALWSGTSQMSGDWPCSRCALGLKYGETIAVIGLCPTIVIVE